MTAYSKDKAHPFSIALGIYDAPDQQAQPCFYLDYYRNNVFVFGGPMMGKTTLIKTFLTHLHKRTNCMPREDVYIIDFGGNIGDYARLGNVCACFDHVNEENIKRVFRKLEDRLSENAERLCGENFYTKALQAPKMCPPHITLIVENVNTFLSDERYEHYQDKLVHLCRDGLSKGLSVIMTANDVSGTARLLTNCGQKIAFDMPNDAYFDIFNTKVLKPMKLPGRGIINLDSGIYEFQCFMPFVNEVDLYRLIERTSSTPNENRMVSFVGDLTMQNIADQCGREYSIESNQEGILVGLDYYQHEPVVYDYRVCPVLAIYSKRDFGLPNLLQLLLSGLNEKLHNARYIYMDDGRKMLMGYYHQDLQHQRNSMYFTDIVALRRYLIDQEYVKTTQRDGANYRGIRSQNSPGTTATANPSLGGAGISGMSGLPGFTKFPGLPEIPEPVVSSECEQTSVLTQSKNEPAIESEFPQYTVFVLQGKSLYHTSNGRLLLKTDLPEMISCAEENGYIFIFSDVKNITDVDVCSTFNNYISSVFLLDDIGEFVTEKGNKTPFGEMNSKELKAEYARCVVGDAFYYDIGTDSLKKLKMIKMSRGDENV